MLRPRTLPTRFTRRAGLVAALVACALVLPSSMGAVRVSALPGISDPTPIAPDCYTSRATAMSPGGYVAGTCGGYAFLWKNGAGSVTITAAPLDGFTQPKPSGVNDHGQVVGTVYDADYREHAFSWTQAGGMIDLGTVAFPVEWHDNDPLSTTSYEGTQPATSFWSRGSRVNNAGQVVGMTTSCRDVPLMPGMPFLFPTCNYHTFLWTAAGGMVDLNAAGTRYSEPYGLNEGGQVAGHHELAGVGNRAFFWSPATGMVDIGALNNEPTGSAIAYAMNEAGQAVGTATTSLGVNSAMSWTSAGGMVDLGSLGGNSIVIAQAVNENGQVAGYSEIAPSGSGAYHAFLWTTGVGMQDLGTLGSPFSLPWGVSPSGEVVGYSYTAGYATRHPFYWSQASGIVDLDPAGTSTDTDEAIGITGSGLIAGSLRAGSNDQAVVWQVNDVPPDTTPPVITITTPSAGGTYSGVVLANFACGDALAGTASCTAVDDQGAAVLNGALLNTSVNGAHALTVTATDHAGNQSTQTVNYTVQSVEPPPTIPGHMEGGGSVSGTGSRVEFELNVKESTRGERGKVSLVIKDAPAHSDGDGCDHDRRRGKHKKNDGCDHDRDGRRARAADQRFTSTSIGAVAFSDDPGFRPGRKTRPLVDTVVFSGTGRWNGSPGYTFDAKATDRGEPGRGRDTFAITVKNGAGVIVATVDGVLDGGNLQSSRLGR